MTDIKSYIKLSRPVNVFLGIVSVIITAAFFTPFPPILRILGAMAVVSFMTAGGNAVNDYYDIDIDRINKPDRPLPAGLITRDGALGFAVTVFVLANILSLMLGFGPFVVSGIIAAPLLYFYARSLKSTPVIGNIIVSLILGLTFIYAAVVFGNMSLGYMPAVLAFFFNLIREIVKDIEDMDGDREQDARTLPVMIGENPARVIAGMLALVMLPIIPLPFILGIYGKWYFFVSGIGCGLPVIIIMVKLLNISRPVDYTQLSAILKYDIAIGLIAILLGNL